MKARIIQEPRCVLLWRFDEKSAGYDALAHAARAYKLKIRCTGDGDLAAKVGDLCRGCPPLPLRRSLRSATAPP